MTSDAAITRARTGRGARTAVAAAWLGSLTVVALEALLIPGTANAPWTVAVAVLFGLAPLVLGTVVALRVPGDVTGPLLAAAGFAGMAANAPGDRTPAVLEGTWMLLYLPFALVLLVVPVGRAASRRWRAIGWTLTVVVAAFIVGCAALALAPGAETAVTPLLVGLLVAFLVLLVACAIAPIARYRRAGDEERLRLRWIFVAGTTAPITLLLCWASYLLVGGPGLVAIGLVLMYLAIPVGTTIALVRPTLFDVDRAAVATATATTLTIAVLGVLTAASAVVGAALIDWAPWAALLATAMLTLCAAALAAPLRMLFDRMLYPERGRALAGVRRLVSQVDRGEGAPEELEKVLRVALRDAGLVVGYRRIADATLVDGAGSPVASGPLSTPVHVRGEEIGAIVSSPGRVTRPAAAIARAAAPLVDAARSRAELGRAMLAVEASRERMLRAGYEERRRLERDLHDGAQQRLVALGMRLRVLQRDRSAQGTYDEALDASLDAAVTELGTALAELRQVAHGVRPSALDDGLGPALADLVHLAPGAIELDVADLILPDAVATTAYFVVSEAVANALKHGAAQRIRVTVRRREDSVAVRVDDDGSGGARPRPNGGLRGLADRVEALGGQLRLDSSAGNGTTVEALLPCAS